MGILIRIFEKGLRISVVDGTVGLEWGVLRLDKLHLIILRGLGLWGDNVAHFGIVHGGVLSRRGKGRVGNSGVGRWDRWSCGFPLEALASNSKKQHQGSPAHGCPNNDSDNAVARIFSATVAAGAFGAGAGGSGAFGAADAAAGLR